MVLFLSLINLLSFIFFLRWGFKRKENSKRFIGLIDKAEREIKDYKIARMEEYDEKLKNYFKKKIAESD